MVQLSTQQSASRGALPGRAGIVATQAGDRRADGQRRSISVTRDIVRIDRTLQGIAMRVAVPTQNYRGVALSLLPDADGVLSYQLNLLHSDDDLTVTLDCSGDDLDILADWRLWSRFFGLPALVERETGVVEAADDSLGGLMLGKGEAIRRKPRSRSKRRPMFLARRKAGVAALMATTHAGEREIIARA